MAAGTLTVEVLTEGVHSGDASGVVPSSFRIARAAARPARGRRDRPHPAAGVPRADPRRARRAGAAPRPTSSATSSSASTRSRGARSRWSTDRAEAVLNRTWRPALSVTGADGLPPIASAGNVLRPRTALKLSLRLPPTLDGEAATRDAEARCSKRIRRTARRCASSPIRAPPAGTRRRRRRGSRRRSSAASQAFYGRPAAAMGEGGTIPFMGCSGAHFPRRAVPDHRRAGTEVERARTERVPARSVREEADRVRRAVLGAHAQRGA